MPSTAQPPVRRKHSGRRPDLATLYSGVESFSHAVVKKHPNPREAQEVLIAAFSRAYDQAAVHKGALLDSRREFAARLRGNTRRREMLDDAGGVCSADEAATLLNMSKQAVLTRAAEGHLLGIRTFKQNAVIFPLFQFSKNGDGLLPGMPEVLAELRSQPALDPWAKCNFLLAPRDSLDGKSPLALLMAGDIEQVIALARAYAIA